MTQKQALKIVASLVVISLIALAVMGVLRRSYPEKFDPEVRFQMEKKAEQANKTTADELPINEMDYKATSKNSRGVWAWPYDSAVPVYHNVQLDLYQNRIKDENSLKGITVYLAIDSLTNIDTESKGSQTGSGHQENNTSDLQFSSLEELNEKQTHPLDSQAADQAEAKVAEEKGQETDFSDLGQVSDKDLQKILESISLYCSKSLEALGANVVVLDSQLSQATQKAAFVGHSVLSDFLAELTEQKFTSKPLEKLLSPLESIQHVSGTSDQVQQMFPDIGVSKNQRLLLDVERQYNDRIFLNLKFGQDKSEKTGSLVKYLAGQSAAIGAQTSSMTETTAEKPAYIAYDTDGRLELAELMSKNIGQLIPALKYSGEDGVQEQIVPCLRLINLNSLEIEISSKNQIYDLQILLSEEQHRVYAEAISNAVYEFYCGVAAD